MITGPVRAMAEGAPTGPMVTVCNGSGRGRIGFVRWTPNGFEAFDADQRALGSFRSELEAVAATLQRRAVAAVQDDDIPVDRRSR